MNLLKRAQKGENRAGVQFGEAGQREFHEPLARAFQPDGGRRRFRRDRRRGGRLRSPKRVGALAQQRIVTRAAQCRPRRREDGKMPFEKFIPQQRRHAGFQRVLQGRSAKDAIHGRERGFMRGVKAGKARNKAGIQRGETLSGVLKTVWKRLQGEKPIHKMGREPSACSITCGFAACCHSVHAISRENERILEIVLTFFSCKELRCS